ncbi:MAG: hypothetical protein MZV64_22890 [Ignavibacteriales bacterium]|nr:hypothetical protein [Ignavibacteriales bacterium]
MIRPISRSGDVDHDVDAVEVGQGDHGRARRDEFAGFDGLVGDDARRPGR